MMLRKFLVFLCVTAVAVVPAFASDATDVMSSVQQIIDASNKNDASALLAGFMPSLVVVEDVPPYVFQGKTENVLADEDKALSADSKSKGITGASIELLTAKFIKVSGTHAYVVVPAIYSFRKNMRLSRQKAIVTVVLEKVKERWLIDSWVWSRWENPGVNSFGKLQ